MALQSDLQSEKLYVPLARRLERHIVVETESRCEATQRDPNAESLLMPSEI